MAASAARNTMMPQPASFQTAWAVTRYLNASGSVMTSQVCQPCRRSMVLSAPAPPSISWKTVTTRTQEKKCGRYTTDCTNERSFVLTTSLNTSASTIGTGKYRISWTALMTRVLLSACQKIGSSRSRSKFPVPTRGLYQNPE